MPSIKRLRFGFFGKKKDHNPKFQDVCSQYDNFRQTNYYHQMNPRPITGHNQQHLSPRDQQHQLFNAALPQQQLPHHQIQAQHHHQHQQHFQQHTQQHQLILQPQNVTTAPTQCQCQQCLYQQQHQIATLHSQTLQTQQLLPQLSQTTTSHVHVQPQIQQCQQHQQQIQLQHQHHQLPHHLTSPQPHSAPQSMQLSSATQPLQTTTANHCSCQPCPYQQQLQLQQQQQQQQPQSIDGQQLQPEEFSQTKGSTCLFKVDQQAQQHQTQSPQQPHFQQQQYQSHSHFMPQQVQMNFIHSAQQQPASVVQTTTPSIQPQVFAPQMQSQQFQCHTIQPQNHQQQKQQYQQQHHQRVQSLHQQLQQPTFQTHSQPQLVYQLGQTQQTLQQQHQHQFQHQVPQVESQSESLDFSRYANCRSIIEDSSHTHTHSQPKYQEHVYCNEKVPQVTLPPYEPPPDYLTFMARRKSFTVELNKQHMTYHSESLVWRRAKESSYENLRARLPSNNLALGKQEPSYTS